MHIIGICGVKTLADMQNIAETIGKGKHNRLRWKQTEGKEMLYKYRDIHENYLETIDLTKMQSCEVFHVHFVEGVVSRVVIKAVHGDWVFISLYAGNIELASVVVTKDFVTEFFDLGEVKNKYFTIREARHYDY